MAGIQNIRKNLSGPTAKVISWAIIITFALFFGWGTVFSGSDANNVLSVNGKKVDVFDLQNEMGSLQQQIREQFENQDIELDTELLKQLAINSLINDNLISSHLEGEGLNIPDSAVYKVLSLDPSFVEDGVFNRERFDLIALQNGISPSKLLENFKQELMIRYWNVAIGQSEFLSQTRFDKSLELANQTRDISFTRLDFSEEEDNVKYTDELLEDYFNLNQNKFLSEEKFSISYIDISSQQFSDESVSQQDLESEYTAYVEDFDSSIRRKASHLMINVNTNETPDFALEKARSILGKIQEDNFSDLVAEFSDDEGSKNNGGDLGTSDGTAFPPEFEEALEKLEVGEVSDPIYLVDSNSYHILKLTELISPKPESFEERKSKIESSLTQDLRQTMYSELFEDLSDLSFSLEELDLIAEELNLEIKKSDLATLKDLELITSDPQLRNILLNREINPGQTSEIIELSGNRALLIRVDEYQDAFLKDFDDVRSEVESLYSSEKAEESFIQKEQELLDLFNSSDSFEISLQERGLKSETYKNLSRNSSLFPRSVMNDIFEISRSNIGIEVYSSTLSNGDKIIFSLDSINPAENNLSRTEEGDKAFKDFLSQERSQSLLSELQTTLRGKADISTKEVELIN